MLKRKVYDSLFEWKTNRGDECLLIKGARQIGKTYVVEQFGKNEYESFIEINFLKRRNKGYLCGRFDERRYLQAHERVYTQYQTCRG